MQVETLHAVPLFAQAPPEALAALSAAMTTRTVPAGELVWAEGTWGDELALVLDGALVARVGVQEVGSVRAGELVGEAGVFFADARIASVHATLPTTLAVLPRPALLGLADATPSAYNLLLELALEALARHVQDTGRRIALLGNDGVEPPQRAAPSLFTRLLRVANTSPDVPTDPAIHILRKLPVLGRADAATLARIAAAFRPRRLQVDEVLFLESEPGDSAFVLGEGEVDVVRAVRGGKARRLASGSPSPPGRSPRSRAAPRSRIACACARRRSGSWRCRRPRSTTRGASTGRPGCRQRRRG